MGRNVSRWKLAAFLLVTAGAVGGAAWGFVRAKKQVAVSVQGAAPAQRVMSEPALWARFVDVRAERLAMREVFLRFAGENYAISQGKLGYELDRAALATAFAKEKAAQSAAPRVLPWQERADVVELPVRFDLDEAAARSALEKLAPVVRREPVDARVLVREHRVVRAQAGVELDVEGTLERLREADPKEGMVLEAAFRSLPPRVTDDMVVAIDVSKIMSSFETDFRKKAPSRAVNIARAAAYLDQQILRPGEVFSFNRTVGERTHERGFIDAPVIVNDELEKGVGGGVCQVASTFHAAVRFANLDVLERRSHSRPTGYAPLGLDAVVIDGKQDLRVRNPYDTPLLIHAYLPSKYVIRVELLGRAPEAKVEHDIAVKETKPFTRRVWHRDDVEPTSVKRKQEGTKGYDITSVLTIRHADGREERRTYPSMYYPVPEVFWIGRQADMSALPALPEGASDTLVDPVMPDPTGVEPVSTTANPTGLGASEPLL